MPPALSISDWKCYSTQYNLAILLGTTALLLLNSPYTLGNFIRIRGKKRGLYLLQPQENPRLLSQTQFNSLCTECSANVHMKPIATSTSRDSM
ncbi:hypothetical protein OESDEN_05312 [Oesophagostomum dentatum]|uniref:Uncharacterized protein n=1 Tax=Oesophagostomum dentatum TaxID=61180 RepID=A0A0B1TH76_OESDE|nr:hypothetical protein OESDEN_05312 [Oesophagostomum dentatum]